MRRTKLSFEQIKEELGSPEADFLKGFLIAEMGELLLEGGERADEAEAFLRDLLNSDELVGDKKIAFCFLDALEYMDRETFRAIEAFAPKAI